LPAEFGPWQTVWKRYRRYSATAQGLPQPSDQIGHRKQRGSAGGRPPAFDKEDYKGRYVVERNFGLFEQWRGLATRYDKLALTYRGGAVLRAATIWLATLGDTP
jgi:putative transposase